MPENIHEGHRQRLKRRFLQEGLDQFEEAQVLELLLFYAIPRKDTEVIAYALLHEFGSLSGVMDAPVSALEQVPGVGSHAASLIHLTTALGRYYMVNRGKMDKVLTTVHQCGEYLVPRFFGLRVEAVGVLCLDAKCKVLACRILGHGSVNSAAVPIRKIVEFALSVNASSLILAHNHPTGIALPSKEDVAVTRQLDIALDAVGIVLADHIIVADGDFVSLTESNLYRHTGMRELPGFSPE